MTPLGYWLSGCSAGPTAEQGQTTQPTTSPSQAPPTSPPLPPVVLPQLTPWTPLDGEVEPGCKVAAVEAVVTALTTTAGIPRPPVPAGLQGLAEVVPVGATSGVQVIYPQYGGLNTDRSRASVMLVADLLTLSGEPAQLGRTSLTLDVRLTRIGQAWGVSEVLVPTARTVSTAVAGEVTALLDNPRVSLPGQARLDLAEGVIDLRVVTLLGTLSGQWRLGVQVLRTGHPVNVFDTDRLSNHTRGRAVDVWALDDVPVIAHQSAPWEAVMRAGAAAGASEVGGPVKLDGHRPYFSDLVHQDHLHFGFD